MKRGILGLLTFAMLCVQAQVSEDVKEVAKQAPKIYKTVEKQVKEAAEATPGLLSTVGTAVKDGANTVVTGAKDATNFVDTSSNFRWMLNKTNDFVVSTAAALKIGAEKVLYIMAKKYFLMGIYAWLAVVGCLLGAVFLYRKSMEYMSTVYEHGNPLPIFGLIITLIFVGIMYVHLQDAINYTFNPEYYVLQELKNFVLDALK